MGPKELSQNVVNAFNEVEYKYTDMKKPAPASSPTPTATLGATIRILRLQQGRTQEEIAKACDFSKSLLCKIEAGKTYPPIATLARIAAALGVPISGLLESPGSAKAVFTAKADVAKSMTATEKGYSVCPLAAGFTNKSMQPFIFTARQGEVAEHALSHPGEEFILVLDGEIRFRVGHTDYLMRAGDSLYFDAREPHGMQPITSSATYLDMFM